MSYYAGGDGSIITQLLQLFSTFKTVFVEVLWVLGLLWIIQLFNSMSGNVLCVLGIIPRNPIGLLGIIFSPFIHGGFGHLFFNSVPFLLLLSFMMTLGTYTSICATVTIMIIGGAAVWLFGRHAIHVGASGLIMGYMGFILYNAYYNANLASVVVGIVSLYYLGTILFSLMPDDASTSWEGHVFGFAAGIFAAHFGCLAVFASISNFFINLLY